jgi:hypothetical protein
MKRTGPRLIIACSVPISLSSNFQIHGIIKTSQPNACKGFETPGTPRPSQLWIMLIPPKSPPNTIGEAWLFLFISKVI